MCLDIPYHSTNTSTKFLLYSIPELSPLWIVFTSVYFTMTKEAKKICSSMVDRLSLRRIEKKRKRSAKAGNIFKVGYFYLNNWIF